MGYNKELWNEIITIGKKQEPKSKGVANRFNKDDVHTIVATIEFFGATDIWMKQTYFDLSIPKYRLFDWLGMSLNGRNDDNRKQNEQALKVLVHAYLKVGGVPDKFIEDLRISDYQVDTAWEEIEIDVEE